MSTPLALFVGVERARLFTAKVIARTVGVLGNGTTVEVIAPLAGGRITGGLSEVLASASDFLSIDANIFIGTVLAVIVGVDSARSRIIRIRQTVAIPLRNGTSLVFTAPRARTLLTIGGVHLHARAFVLGDIFNRETDLLITTIFALVVRKAITWSFTQARAIAVFAKRETRFEVGAPSAITGHGTLGVIKNITLTAVNIFNANTHIVTVGAPLRNRR